MKKNCSTLLIFALLAGGGCASTEHTNTPDSAPAQAEPAPQDHVSAASEVPPTKYRKGDYVRYEYRGSALAHPVILDEMILSQEGNQLEIHVRATKKDDVRQWVQVVTDTPHNQANNVIDGLFEIVNGERVRLENIDNRDVYRLYEWTFPPPFQPEGKPESITRSVDIDGSQQDAQCTTMKGKSATNTVVAVFCKSSAFLWTNVYGQVISDPGGEVLWEMVVVKAGRDTP